MLGLLRRLLRRPSRYSFHHLFCCLMQTTIGLQNPQFIIVTAHIHVVLYLSLVRRRSVVSLLRHTAGEQSESPTINIGRHVSKGLLCPSRLWPASVAGRLCFCCLSSLTTYSVTDHRSNVMAHWKKTCLTEFVETLFLLSWLCFLCKHFWQCEEKT